MQIEKRPSLDQGEREGAWGKKKQNKTTLASTSILDFKSMGKQITV